MIEIAARTPVTNIPTMPAIAQKAGVQSVYTEAQVSQFIRAKYAEICSLREIAKSYGKPITHADIERILKNGKFPVGLKKRTALNVPPVCPKCEQPLPKPPRPARVVKFDPAQMEAVIQFLREREKPTRRVYARGGKIATNGDER
jgi:hypothetical protein